jgi:transcriptional regulator with XRE-family HTH domain
MTEGAGLQKRVGRRIAELRAGKLSQEQLAEMAGVSVGYLSRIERGAVGPDGVSLRLVERLATALSVDPAELFRPDKGSAARRVGKKPRLDQLVAVLAPDDLRLVEALVGTISRLRAPKKKRARRKSG